MSVCSIPTDAQLTAVLLESDDPQGDLWRVKFWIESYEIELRKIDISGDWNLPKFPSLVIYPVPQFLIDLQKRFALRARQKLLEYEQRKVRLENEKQKTEKAKQIEEWIERKKPAYNSVRQLRVR